MSKPRDGTQRGRARLALLALGGALVAAVAWLVWRDQGAGRAWRDAAADRSDERGDERRSPGDPMADGRAAVAEPATDMHVTVVSDAAGAQPIDGARVQTFEDSVPGTFRTDAEGKCWLPVAPAAGTMRLLVEAEGWFHVNASFDRREPPRISLTPATTLFGRVYERESGRTVAGATVSFAHDNCQGCEPQSAMTDARGAYEIAGVPAREVGLLARAEGFPLQRFLRQLAGVHARVQCDLALETGVAVALRVVDHGSEQPVEGVTVRTIDLAGRTGPDGRLRLFVLPSERDGQIRFRLRRPDYCQLRCQVAPQDLSDAGEVLVRYPRSAPVQGTVRDLAGRPIAQAQIRVARDHQGIAEDARAGKVTRAPSFGLGPSWRLLDEEDWVQAKTDDQGRYRTPGVVPSTSRYLVAAYHPDHQYGQVSLAQAPEHGQPAVVDIVLQPLPAGGTVIGRLTLNGAPVAGHLSWNGETRDGGAEVASDGAFRLERVEAGDAELTVVVASIEKVTRKLQIRAGEQQRCDVDLQVAMTSISGRVTHADGRPGEGESVTAFEARDGHAAWPNLQFRASVVADRDGAFSIAVPEGKRSYWVSAGTLPRSAARQDVAPGAAGVDLVLPAVGSVRFRVLDQRTRRTVSGADLYVKGPTATRFEQEYSAARAPDPEGWCRLEVVLGQYDLMARAAGLGYEPCIVPGVRVLDAAQPPRVTFELQRGATVRVRLAPGQQALPQRDMVVLWREGETDPNEARTFVFDAAGNAAMRGLSAGRYRFATSGDELAFEPATVEVARGEEVAVELRWHAKEK